MSSVDGGNDPPVPSRGRRSSIISSPSNHSSRSTSGSSGARSRVDRDEISTLFISETISRDDTQGKKAKEEDMLARLTDNFNTADGLLLAGAQSSTTPSVPGFPPQPTLEPIGNPVEPGSGRPLFPRPNPRRWHHMPPGQVPPPGRAPRPPRSRSIPEPTAKVLSSASWRKELGALMPGGDGAAESSSAGVPLTKSPTEGGAIENSVSRADEDPACLSNVGQSSSPTDDTKNVLEPEVLNPEEMRLASSACSDSIVIPSNLGLAGCLGYIAQQFNVRVIGESNDATFPGFLLDTINLLERRVRYLQLDENDDSSSDDGSEDGNLPARSQTLHRVYCTHENHEHSRAIYADEPTFSHDPVSGEKILAGKVAITNMGRYTSQHPSICFIVFKEHSCVLDKVGRNGPPFPQLMPSKRSERIRIVSPTLKKALERVAEFQVFNHDDEMDAPYNFLFHHRKKLADPEQKSTELRGVLAPLLEFLDANYDQEYQDAVDMFQRGAVTARHFGKLFKPNQMVLARPRGSEKLLAFVLKSHPFLLEKQEKYSFRGWSWQYNGSQLQRRPLNTYTDPISDEETLITDFAVHPAEYARKQDLEMLKERGRKFWDMKKQDHVSYTGWDYGQSHYYVDSRFMVDTATYVKMYPGSFLYSKDTDDPLRFDPWPIHIRWDEELSQDQLLLLPPNVNGFNLHDKSWVLLDIQNIRPVEWDKKAFDRLVLDAKTKELIYALVDVQNSGRNKVHDIIKGKGNGLIILLHGSPGTGKTLTAESVAEIAEKPLYRVTCGDIGTSAPTVEKYLESVMYLGKTWDCVLLLDEADVYLEERTMADLERNSLVSVFLRILEYYEGILILTSNRVGTFDEAFKSRIQVAIHYDKLTKRSRRQIWQNFFDMLEESPPSTTPVNDQQQKVGRNAEEEEMPESPPNVAELEHHLDELASEEMNGRQIRNAIVTARQLAKHRRERLGWDHLSQVIRTAAAFNRYLEKVRGHDDEQWAKAEMIR